jgi:hypothetical protein
MSKVRTTLTIDESVMRAVKMRAARTGRGDSQVIEESLRRDMGLDLLDRLWEKTTFPSVTQKRLPSRPSTRRVLARADSAGRC